MSEVNGSSTLDLLRSPSDYTVLASNAQLLGVKYSDPVLSSLGAEFARLHTNIPYESDQYYKVHSLARNIEQRIALNENKTEVGRIIIPESYGYSFAYDRYINNGNLVNEVVLKTNRSPVDESDKDYPIPISRRVNDIFQKLINSELSRIRTKSSQGSSSGDGYSEQWDEIKGEDSEVIYFDRTHIHENGIDEAFWRSYFISDQKKAEAFWEKVKLVTQKLIENPEVSEVELLEGLINDTTAQDYTSLVSSNNTQEIDAT